VRLVVMGAPRVVSHQSSVVSEEKRGKTGFIVQAHWSGVSPSFSVLSGRTGKSWMMATVLSGRWKPKSREIKM